jgi:hypothetical protein
MYTTPKMLSVRYHWPGDERGPYPIGPGQAGQRRGMAIDYDYCKVAILKRYLSACSETAEVESGRIQQHTFPCRKVYSDEASA